MADSETIVKRRCTLTWSSSATSTAASPPPPVSCPNHIFPCHHILIIIGHLIYKCGGIDKRTIEKFEKVCAHFHFIFIALMNHCLVSLSIMFWWGRGTKISQGCERLVPVKMSTLMLIFALISIATTAIPPKLPFPHTSLNKT